MKKDDARKQFMRKMEKSVIFSKVQTGKEYVFEGVVRRNKLFERLEFIVNSIKDIDIKKIIIYARSYILPFLKRIRQAQKQPTLGSLF